MAKHVDPICGMQVEESRAAGEAEYEGRRYYFCSGGCRFRVGSRYGETADTFIHARAVQHGPAFQVG